jgi:polysaccharide pyruvyl transferase WcaK-like protein
VYNDPAAAARFGLRGDYRAVVRELVRRLLAQTEATIVLVPHVLARVAPESDPLALADLRDGFPGNRDRLVEGPVLDDARQTKWLIAQMDWFCGTRMHATIAALSSGVPAASLAYSGKTEGVFASCNQASEVADLRVLSTSDAADAVWRSWLRRDETRRRLHERLPQVVQAGEDELDLVVELSEGAPSAASSQPGPGPEERR